MSRFSRIEVFSQMEKTGLVPLFFHEDAHVVKQVVKACYLGGARLFEFTSRGDFAHEVFADLAKFCQEECPDLMLGVGSVTDAAAASLYMQMGANFVVTPVFREDIAIACNRRKVLWSPGCGTLTEIAKAEEYGCELVKLFPGDVYGAEFVKGVKGPCPWTNIMPTGGVSPTEENLRYWFEAGVSCVGMGSQLVLKSIVSSGDYKALELKVRDTLGIIQKIKGS
ncbi:bifunctional 4-hydroxy-2-oxoglutarate aldolase/2-dehydro-3-deoxy-phosphogluconate aldolase [Fulvivirga sp. 29W222]|uniref:Bifunctional 4-hydroxy-2-oxoglutarate aldolase/2-dehydro-3-deoxy-phosphogluconate aldolase n=1 Tax=Fulvivirga marina TaxID=2494733 RepID=A0A937FZY6_9BACT|nr:bifunctional 4-hydroxy-2-oxoglutarate aldolase/2-dehydro-3-deoxy-phosphogluconate aldolase [Fulvivirga marina]MBL6449274.1 bifunctional 4-hydroxy-2-oxoglutarate aldolase/2-dehydro-3-deoxy-phosphogluconate aldolase [Fulvivirga marina]